jgi:hypothetical protein
MSHAVMHQVATQAHVGAHLVLLILACIFFAFGAFSSIWPPSNPPGYYSRLNAIAVGLFFWSLSWFF